MTLVDFSRNELELAGLFKEDSDYNGMLGKAVMDLVELFALQNHSGFSAPLAVNLFSKLALFEPITALSYEEDDWHDQSDRSGAPLWQHKRDSKIFSNDQGKTYWSVDQPDLVHHRDEQ